MTDDNSDDDRPESPIAEIFKEMEKTFERAADDILDGLEQADRERRAKRSPMEKAAEAAKDTAEEIRINIEDELDTIREEQGKNIEDKAEDEAATEDVPPASPPADAQYCPSCGTGLTGDDVEFTEDLLLNRYRMPMRCRSCGFTGEVVRYDL